MNREQLEIELEKVQKAIFFEQMADFMNWDSYYKLRAQERELLKRLKDLGA